jgi:predicted nucleotidyltransferase
MTSVLGESTIPGIEEKHTLQILNLFKPFSANLQVLLFGSRAKGNYREGSDIDLAVKGSGFKLSDRDQLLSQYENLYLPWKLDVVVYSSIEEPALKEHIDRVGKKVYP